AAAAAGRSVAAASTPTWMYVGSFTGEGRGHGEGLSVFHRAGESDRWQRVQLLKDLADPSFVIIDRRRGRLYSAHGDGTQATAYTIDQANGRVSVLNQQPTGGRNGVHLAIDATGGFLVLANYATGTVALLPITQDGSLGPRTDLVTLTGTPGPHRTQQESSHPHHCPFDPAGRLVVVPDKGLDKVFAFHVDTAHGRLVPATPPHVASPPRAAAPARRGAASRGLSSDTAVRVRDQRARLDDHRLQVRGGHRRAPSASGAHDAADEPHRQQQRRRDCGRAIGTVPLWIEPR